jgi:hypothetical protein
MAGSETRQRQITLKARFNDREAALIKEQADRAGVSVSALIRHAVLEETPLRASRRPPAERADICRLVGALGALAQALREVQITGVSPLEIEAMHGDLADMRVALFEALGRQP